MNLELAYRTVDSPVGSLLLATTESGLVRLAYANEGHAHVLQSLADRLGQRPLPAPGRLDDVARQLADYFGGRLRHFRLRLDLSLAHGFRRTVLDELLAIDYAASRSYAELAVALGRNRAARAVGTACALNPIPIVVPCHRIRRSDGSPGGYIGGLDAKAALLALEASVADRWSRPSVARHASPGPIV